MTKLDAGLADAEAAEKLAKRVGRIIAAARHDIKGVTYQRQARRRATAHLGLIETADGRGVDCNILELTDVGMRIGLRATFAPPSHFIVRIPALKIRYAVSLKWTGDHVLGAEILAPLPNADAAKATRRKKSVFGETCRQFLIDESGSAAIEYALLAVMMASIAFFGAAITGESANRAIAAVARALDGPPAGPHGPGVETRDEDGPQAARAAAPLTNTSMQTPVADGRIA
jgi:Flp pilus assembly pilin Flp